ncbi:MAG TPA: hypothetical protein VFV37_08755 [Luteibaculaceae bacterium]|nr:hypothetical protein [Luteibaculaceae bacterium]
MDLIQKLDAFIRKYYKNQLIKGGLYTCAVVFGLLLAVSVAEYFGRFNGSTRMVIFLTSAIAVIFTLIKWIIIPLMKINRLGPVISYRQASVIIGNHFPEVGDKLLNTLQLLDANAASSSHSDLLLAAIEQKTLELRPVPFVQAIDFRTNKRYLKIALPPLAAVLLLVLAYPAMITESAKRIVQFDREFIPEAPFALSVSQYPRQVVQGQSAEIVVRVTGSVVPSAVYLELDGSRFRMQNESGSQFRYTFDNLQQDLSLVVFAEGFYSKPFEIRVLQKPVVKRMQIRVSYPKYLNKAPETIENTGDLNVPEGAVATWLIEGRQTKRCYFIDGAGPSEMTLEENTFKTTKRLLNSLGYQIVAKSTENIAGDTLNYQIQVVKDQFPTIGVETRQDTASLQVWHFNVSFTDDYGFTDLIFYYRDKEVWKSKKLPISDASAAGRVYQSINLQELDISGETDLEYYFQIRDNDGVNGPKAAKSAVQKLDVVNQSEAQDLVAQKSDNIKKELNQSIKEAKNLQQELNKLQREMLNDKNLDWKDKKKLQELLNREKNLEKKIEELKQENELKNLQEQQFNLEQSQEILEKQQQLEKLFEEVMTEEMKDLFKQMQDLLEKGDQEKLLEKMKDLQMSTKDVEQEMDRMLDLFKQLEVEQQMTKSIEKLKNLAEEQKKLADPSNPNTGQQEKEKQNQLNEEFKQLQEQLKELEKKAEEIQSDISPKETQAQQEEVKANQEKASEQLDKNQQQKANESQQKAGEKMEEMAQEMEKQMSESQEEQQGEDMNALRQILENLIKLSLNQEDVLNQLGKTGQNDPRYVALTQSQKNIKDDAKIIKDSLFALSKRVPQLQSIVNREISAINRNMDDAIEQMAERISSQALVRQQYAMTSLNNLALILDAALKQMQEQMKNQKQGSANCNKPGKGQKPSPGNMSKMQEQLSKQLDQMKKKMDEAKGKDPGKKGSTGESGMSQELAKMAAQQAAIRRQVEKMAQELNKEGKGAGNKLKDLAKQMEETEKDIVNKQIKTETIRRQQDIMTRLLEHEKAEREREQDPKRESKQPRNYPTSNPASYFEYNKTRMNSSEMIKTVPVGLKPYYRRKSEMYLNGTKP